MTCSRSFLASGVAGLVLVAACAASPRAGSRASTPAATTPAPARSTPPQERPVEQWLTELMTHEATAPLAPRDIVLPDGSFRGTARGSAPATLEREEHFMVATVPIGSEAPMICNIHDTRINLATAVRVLHESIKQNLERTQIHGIGAGYEGDTPFLDFRVLYLVPADAGNLVGLVKVRAANVGAHGIYCVHDEPGYVRTFDQATRPLLAQPAATPRPERYLLLLDGSPLGYFSFTVRSGADGSWETDRTSTLAARTAGDLMAVDRLEVDHWSASGETLEETVDEVENGEPTRHELRRQGTTLRYHVEGTHLGRPLSGDFTATEPLRSGLPGLERAYRLLVGPGAPATVREFSYVRSINPLQASESTYALERVVDAGHAWITHRTGPLQSRILARSTGVFEELEAPLAGHTLTMRRVVD